jgi:hypothetical protein
VSKEEIDMTPKNIKQVALNEEAKGNWQICLPRLVCIVPLRVGPCCRL